MFRPTFPPAFLSLTLSAVALLLLPLLLLACGVEESTERPTREPRDTATEVPDERDEEPTVAAPGEPTEPSEERDEEPTVAAAGEPTAAPTVARAPTPTVARAPTPTVARAPTPTVARAPTPTSAPRATPSPTRRPPRATPTPRPQPAATPRPQPTPARYGSLQEYAASMAGGPGAIYVGDLNTLVGQAPSRDLGDEDGIVSPDALQRHAWIFDSDYYRSLLDKARITDPARLTSSGERVTIQFACINRALNPCRLLESYFAPNVLERTNGQVDFEISSYPELGIAGFESLDLLASGTLDAATLYGGYLVGDFPALEIQTLWGSASSAEESYLAAHAVIKDLDSIVANESGGVIFSHGWFAGFDQFLFCKDAIESASDFQGKRTRSYSAALSDWINGMGGSAQFVAFAEVYTALVHGILDCGITGADPGFGQRWYEVTDNVIGPLYGVQAQPAAISGDIWNRIPADLQLIILEEGAKLELEALRLAPAQNEVGLTRLQDAGMEYIPFSLELQRLSRQAVVDLVIPAWINRVGRTNDPIITDTFNNKVGPIVGLRIERDGRVVDLGSPAASTSTTRPTPAPEPEETATSAQAGDLQEYAAQNAGGPGAIYVGDLRQLAGPAPSRELGDRDGNVSLNDLQTQSWLYKSDYYQSLLAKASLSEPTRLASSGKRIEITYACINRTLLPCQLMSNYFAPNVQERTNGQVRFEIASFLEFGVSGEQTFDLLSDGTLDGATLYGGYVSEEFPAFGVQQLHGAVSSAEESYWLSQAVMEDLDRIAAAESGGAVFSHGWYTNLDEYIFCQDALSSASDIQGKKIRSFGTEVGNWIDGMGGDPQSIAFAEVYTALERGLLACGMTSAKPAFQLRWYEVSSYMMGPLYNVLALSNVISGDVWDAIPADLQQIILEEGAKLELEALRLAPAQSAAGVQENIDAGMEYIPFSPELQQQSRQAAMSRVIPLWVDRVGNTSDPIIADTFNNKVGPIVGMRIESDGSVTDLR